MQSGSDKGHPTAVMGPIIGPYWVRFQRPCFTMVNRAAGAMVNRAVGAMTAISQSRLTAAQPSVLRPVRSVSDAWMRCRGVPVRGGSGEGPGSSLSRGGGLFRALFKGSWFPLIGFWLLKEAKKRWRSVIGSRMVGGLGALSNPYSFFFGCAGGALQIRFLHNLPSIKSPVTSNWDYRSTLINLWLWVKTETP